MADKKKYQPKNWFENLEYGAAKLAQPFVEPFMGTSPASGEYDELIKSAFENGGTANNQMPSPMNSPLSPEKKSMVDDYIKNTILERKLSPAPVPPQEMPVDRKPQAKSPMKQADIQGPMFQPDAKPTEKPQDVNPMDEFSDAKYKEAQERARSRQGDTNIAEFFSGLGGAISGRGLSETNEKFGKIRDRIKDEEVGDFERRRKSKMEEIGFGNEQKKQKRDDDLYNPESNQSVSFRKTIEANFPAVAKAYGENWQNVSAADREAIFEPLKLKETIEGRKEQMRLLAQARQDSRQDKIDKELDARYTNYGIARTADDAKKLKDAGEIKAQLDTEIGELIQLRQKYGSENWNRDAIARAKQLSKSLLLKKKNLESLGVLSKSDMDIVNEIIPEDPLQWDSSILVGQDPTMTKLKNFQSDTNRDFGEKVRNRVVGGDKMPSKQFPMQIRKGNQTATVNDENELREAKEEGWQ